MSTDHAQPSDAELAAIFDADAGPPPAEPPPEEEGPPPDLMDEDGDEASMRVQLRLQELRSRLLDAGGLQNIPAPAPLVEGWLFADSIAWLAGKPGHAKTFVAVDLAACVATGQPWHGHPTKQGPVLYILAEGASGLGQRVEAWALGNAIPVTGVRFLPVPVNLAESVDVSAASRLLGELRPVLVIIDTQARVTLGLDENSSKDMGRFVEVLERLRRESHACLLLVHHEPRSGDNLRGSTALEGAATTILRAVKDGQVVTVSNTKQKDAEPATSMALALQELAGSCILSHEAVGLASLMTSSEHALLGLLWESFGTNGATKTELKEATDLPKSTFYRALKALVSAGKVTEQVEGRTRRYLPTAMDGQPEIPTSPTGAT